ncbi:MAG: hypothetical protein LBK02_08985 [Treponema sp.]|jgi:hypothetical protein|nr:hypothetical protein [Treponema sp.]
MTGAIEANLAAMPGSNLIIIFIGAAGLLVIAAVIMKWLGIMSVGPIKREQQNQSVVYQMNEENYEHDELLRSRLRDYTDEMRVALVNSFEDFQVDDIVRRALSSAIRFPMYKSINNNHFTKVLMPDKRQAYEVRIIRQLKTEYIDLYNASRRVERNALPSWEDGAEKIIMAYFRDWMNNTLREVSETCADKVKTYRDYRQQIKSEHWRSIIDMCITKNEDYISKLH